MSSKEKPMVIEISSSSDEETNKNKRKSEKGRRRKKRRIYSDVEVNTREEKRREEEECCILPFDPFAADLHEKLSLPVAQHQLDDLSVLAERGQVFLSSLSFCFKFSVYFSSLLYSSGERYLLVNASFKRIFFFSWFIYIPFISRIFHASVWFAEPDLEITLSDGFAIGFLELPWLVANPIFRNDCGLSPIHLWLALFSVKILPL